MEPTPFFFVMAIAIIAPHLKESEAKGFSLLCIALGLLFWSIWS
jgi:hypothetical protein